MLEFPPIACQISAMKLSFAERIHAGMQRAVRRLIWGMDIAPSAVIAPSAMIDRTWPRGIHIEADCVICEEAVVLAHDFTRGIYVDTRLCARTYVGPRAIILPGVTVGEDCVVAPGALVTRDMPPRHEAWGNPAEIRPR